jgi:hypothetical protein
MKQDVVSAGRRNLNCSAGETLTSDFRQVSHSIRPIERHRHRRLHRSEAMGHKRNRIRET